MNEIYDVVIVGCGVFGLSTALALSNRGLNILALDAYPIPSELAASKDYNKIVRVEYKDELTATLAIEAMAYWNKEELFSPYFVRSGRLTLTPADVNSSRSKYEQQSLDLLKRLGAAQRIVKVTNPKQVGDIAKEFANNNLPETFNASFNYDCGTGLSSDALTAVYKELKKRGIKFVFGDAGRVKKINSHEVISTSGVSYNAKKIVVTAGAGTGLIVPLDNQTKVFGSFVTHVKLTDEEYEKYKNMPIFFSAEYGYFFPPDEHDHMIKIGVTTCDAYAEVDHPFEPGNRMRGPRYSVDHPQETFPINHEKDIKHLLHLVVPELAYHDLVDSKTCWISDSVDSHFLIDKNPYYEDVYVATGDSGHAFKFLPTIGKYIVQRMEGKLKPELSDLWKWKNNPSFAAEKNAQSRVSRPHYNLETTEFIPSKL